MASESMVSLPSDWKPLFRISNKSGGMGDAWGSLEVEAMVFWTSRRQCGMVKKTQQLNVEKEELALYTFYLINFVDHGRHGLGTPGPSRFKRKVSAFLCFSLTRSEWS